MNLPKAKIFMMCALAAISARSTSVIASVKTGGGGNVLCVRGLQNDSIVLAGTAGSGIYRSTDGGIAWMQTGLRESAVNVIVPDPRNASHFYAGTSRGLVASIDGGETWWPIDSMLHAAALVVSASGPRLLLAADGSVVRRTTDDGKSWSTIDALTPYGIRLLSVVRTDSGSFFIAACDSAIFTASENNLSAWVKLPALPGAGVEAPRVTAIVCDTLSREGLQLAAGTSAGVCVYSFAAHEWRRLHNGMAEGRVGAMGLIVYDTTSISRSYSLCASVMGDTMSIPSRRAGVYKISSVSGVINSALAWKMIDDEQIDVRGCFMPDRGANRSKIYLASSDGMRMSYDGGTTWSKAALETYPIASLSSRFYTAGIVGRDGSSRVSVRIANRGEGVLTVRVRSVSDTQNFTIPSLSDSIVILPGTSGAIPVQFNPAGAGKFTVQIVIGTNDPMLSSASVRIAGYSTGHGIMNRTVVIDRAHGGRHPAAYAELAGALALAGMSVIDTLPSSVRSDCALIILPGPEVMYADSEISFLARSVSAGATIAAFGGEDDSSRSVLNRVFASSLWKSMTMTDIPIRFGSSHLSSPQGAFTAARSYSLRSAAYLAHAGTFGFTSASDVIISSSVAGADTLCAAEGITRIDASGAHAGVRAVLGAVARVGSGKVIAIGDTRFWCAETTADEETGLWAADNFSSAMSIAGTVENARVGFPGTIVNEEYRLLSIPYALEDNAAGAVFRSLGKPNPYEWRLFGAWNERTQSYDEYPSPALMTIDRGKGYWLIAKGDHEITPGTADYSLIPEPFTMRLKPGFTLIGDPFPFAIDWRKSAASSNVEPALWAYTGKEFVQTHAMKPFEGYFVCNPTDTDAVVRVMPEPLASSESDRISAMRSGPSAAGGENIRTLRAGSTGSQSDGEWSMHVSATDGTVNDGENYCGMIRSSTDARDANDFTEPPVPPGRFVQFRFTEGGQSALAGDYRSVRADGAFWNCEIRASEPGARVKICLTPETPLPRSFSIFILDFQEERVIDCTGDAAYEFGMKSDEPVRMLRIIAGEKKYIEGHTDGIPMAPLAYELEQNFPNPWNPATTIRYTLAHSGAARIEIYNLLGQKVRTLVDRMLRLGSYAEQWDGRDDRGLSAASGVYIYRLTTPVFTQSKRMVLLR